MYTVRGPGMNWPLWISHRFMNRPGLLIVCITQKVTGTNTTSYFLMINAVIL
jgi:hypothetical protein